MCVLGESPHERQINMHMWVNETGKDIFTRRIDYFVRFDVINVAINSRDRLAFAEDICDITFARGDDFAVLNK